MSIARRELSNPFGLELTKRSSFILILMFTFTVLIDSTIVRYVSVTGTDISVPSGISIFTVTSILFMVICWIVLGSVGAILKGYKPSNQTRRVKYLHLFVCITMVLEGAILLSIMLQVTFLEAYSLMLIRIQTYLSHTSPLIFLSMLIFMFGRWLASKRNYIVLLFTGSFLLISATLCVSLVYLELFFARPDALPDVKPYSIFAFVANVQGGPFASTLSMIFDAVSLAAFLFLWTATALLLIQYRYRIGRVKYFLLISIPLIYFLFPFQTYFRDVSFLIMTFYPVISNIALLISSGSTQLGALVFSLSFWTASALVHDKRLQKSLSMCAIGMAFLFGSIELTPLQYHIYPPYGLITESFIPLGAYLLYVGLFTSASYVSQDSEVRRAFYRSAASQLRLLKTIGVSQLEKQIEAKAQLLQERFRTMDNIQEGVLGEELDEESVREAINDVLTEIYSKKEKVDLEK